MTDEQPPPYSPYAQQAEAQPGATAGAAASEEREVRSPRRVIGIIVAATVLLLAVVGGTAAVTWPHPTPVGHAASFTYDGQHEPGWLDLQPEERTSDIDAAWVSMNEALRKSDRAKFLSYTTGSATKQLARWWDNTKKIGWKTAYILPPEESGTPYTVLGAELAFDAHPLRGSGSEDAGLRLTQSFTYKVTTTGSGKDLRITSITPVAAMPWDEGTIYVAKRKHVVLYGMADEKALVDANAATAEKGAVLALNAIKAMGGKVPMDGFVSAITDRQDRFRRWITAGGTQWGDMDVAGIATSASRPRKPSVLLAPDIATGDAAGGSLEMMGPSSRDQRLVTFTHEFAHALTYAASPQYSRTQKSLAIDEGFATYVEYATHLTPASVILRPEVRQAIASKGRGAFSDAQLRSKDAWIAYFAAGSYYWFVADNGGSPWDLVLDSRESTSGTLDARRLDKKFTDARWQQWVTSH